LFSFVGVDAAMDAMYATSDYFFHMVRCWDPFGTLV